MKIGIITTQNTDREEGSIEIDGWKILIGLLSAGLITSLIAGLTFLLIDLPESNIDRNQQAINKKLEILNFSLRAKSDSLRQKSLIFLLKSGVLSDENGEIKKLLDNNIVPDWSEMPKMNLDLEQNEVIPIPSKKRK